MATTSLTLDGFPFVGTTPEGGRAKVQSLSGWIRRGVRRTRWENTGRRGASASSGLDAEKAIDFTAIIFYDTPEACARERRVIAALGDGDSVTMRVTDADGTLQRRVTIDDIDPQPGSDRQLKVDVTVTADDPIATGITPTTVPVPAGATVPVDTPGTATAELVVTLTSAGTVDLIAGGLRFTTSALPEGAVIDVASQSVRSSSGADLSGAVLRYGSPGLPAGGGTITQAGTAALSVQFFDTYA